MQTDSSISNDAGGHAADVVWIRVSFRKICLLCLVTPLLGLTVCLAIALIFQFNHVQETACKVFNFVPSISAITGIAPGKYFWRVAIALHLGPRLLIATVFYKFLSSLVRRSPGGRDGDLLRTLLRAILMCQVLELAGLCGISFVHNREHYPVHEKGFLVYVASSHASFFLVVRFYGLVWTLLEPGQRVGYAVKVKSAIFSTACLLIMAVSYYRHIVHCDNLAFSVFAFVEYFVVCANMFYYWSIVMDMPDEEILVVKQRRRTS